MGNWPRTDTSQADIESGAEAALEEDISNLSEASGSVADLVNSYLDHALSDIHTDVNNIGGGTDWSSKTYTFDQGATTSTGTDIVSVTGAGFLLSIHFSGANNSGGYRIDIDGSTVADHKYIDSGVLNARSDTDEFYIGISGPVRFDSSFAVGTNSFSDDMQVTVLYALD